VVALAAYCRLNKNQLTTSDDGCGFVELLSFAILADR
jgi:hypothetical protein